MTYLPTSRWDGILLRAGPAVLSRRLQQADIAARLLLGPVLHTPEPEHVETERVAHFAENPHAAGTEPRQRREFGGKLDRLHAPEAGCALPEQHLRHHFILRQRWLAGQGQRRRRGRAAYGRFGGDIRRRVGDEHVEQRIGRRGPAEDRSGRRR